MSDLAVVALLVPLAYLLGTFPSARIAARRAGVDVTSEGSGNPGASNTFRLIGWKAGVLVFLGDCAKGAVAAGVGATIDGHRGAYLCGAAAILGHMLPVTRGWKGGRGVATGAGVILVVFPLLTLGAALVWGAVAKLSRKASLASLTAALAFPVAVAVAGHSAGDVVVVGALAAVVVVRHLANLRRLVRGEEHDLGGHPDPSR